MAVTSSDIVQQKILAKKVPSLILNLAIRVGFRLRLAPAGFHKMSQASERSRITITLGRSGQVVNRDGSELDAGYELPRVGTKRSVKERLGNQLDSSSYVGSEEVVSKRQRGERNLSNNDWQISKNDLRFKLIQKNAQRRESDEGSVVDLREKLSRSEQPPSSLDTQHHMAEPWDVPLLSSRAARGSSQMISSSSSYSPRTLQGIRRRSPERYVDSSRGLSLPRNAGHMIGIPKAQSPPRTARRIIGTPRDLSPPRNGGRIRDQSPPRNAGRRIRDLSPPRNAARTRDLSPPRNAARIIGMSKDPSPPRNAGRIIGNLRDLSPPRHAGRKIGSLSDLSPPRNGGRIVGTPRALSPPMSTRSFSSGSRAMCPTRNVGSYMDSSRVYSPPRNHGSYIGSSRASPSCSNIENFHGRSRMLDDMRLASYTVRGVLNGQAPASSGPFTRPMLPPPIPNTHPLPPLSQFPPSFGSLMQNPYAVEELTVDRFLDSLGLRRYQPAFKREEVDMTTIKQMKESDLKDINIPMGPRKKILEAIASLPK